jgi:hypothetical protein
VKKKDRRRPNHSSTQPTSKTSSSWSATLGDKWPKEAGMVGQNQQLRTTSSKTSPAPLPEKPIRTHQIQPTPQSSQPGKKALNIISQQLPARTSKTEIVSLPSAELNRAASNNRSQTRQTIYADRMSQFLSKKEAEKKREIPIILGIDFGTSSTKVVWREAESDRAHLICFGNRLEMLEDYLLPSIVAFDGDHLAGGLDALPFLEKNSQANGFTNFKMCLACVSSEKSDCNLERCSLSHWRPLLARMIDDSSGQRETIEIISALHIGKVISLSKKHIVENLRTRGIEPQIRWFVNMAAPVEHMGEKSVLEAFERVLKIGWWMAEIFDEESGPHQLDDLLDCYETAKHFAATRSMNCFIYPEVAAQVACMYLSRSARDGIYAFIDVGAGTVDASIFRLASTGQEPQLNFYGASVIKYGAAHLEVIASRQLAERASTWFKSIKESRARVGSAMFLLPEEAGIYLKNAYSWIEKKVESELRLLLGESFAKEQDVRHFRGLHLFLGGGGASIQVYSDASTKALSGLATNLTIEDLPVPQDFDMNGLPSKAFHRFAVAYGLAFNVTNLAEIALPDEVSNLTREEIFPIRQFQEAPTKDIC